MHPAVIRYAAAAAQSHATEVAHALTELLAAPESGRTAAERRLREALVALDSGFEGASHDGSTYEARKAAAHSALVVWSEVLPEAPPEGTARLTLAGRTADVPRDLLVAAGWTIYTDGSVRPQVGLYDAAQTVMACLGALPVDATLERALLLAVERRNTPRSADVMAAAAHERAADAELHAARVHRQAAQLECRARGMPTTLDDRE